MIILGVVLLVLGFVFSIPVLWTIGLVLIAVGVVLMIVGATGRAIGVAGTGTDRPRDLAKAAPRPACVTQGILTAVCRSSDHPRQPWGIGSVFAHSVYRLSHSVYRRAMRESFDLQR